MMMMLSGVTSYDVMDELVFLIRDQWNTTKMGKMPPIAVLYDRTLMGNVGSGVVEMIAIYVDTDARREFNIGGALGPIDWLHRYSCTLVVQTNVGESRMRVLMDSLSAILQKNLIRTSTALQNTNQFYRDDDGWQLHDSLDNTDRYDYSRENGEIAIVPTGDDGNRAFGVMRKIDVTDVDSVTFTLTIGGLPSVSSNLVVVSVGTVQEFIGFFETDNPKRFQQVLDVSGITGDQDAVLEIQGGVTSTTKITIPRLTVESDVYRRIQMGNVRNESDNKRHIYSAMMDITIEAVAKSSHNF